MRTVAAALSITFGVCLLLLWKPASQRAAALAPYAMGDIVALNTLQTLDGQPVDEAELLTPEHRALVLQFWSARCPVSHGYDERFEAFVGTHANDDIEVVRIAAAADEPFDEIRAAHTKRVPLLVDGSGTLLEQLDIDTTPHFVVLDASGALVYSGSFDANLLGELAPEQEYVQRAVEQLLADEPVMVQRSEAFGTRLTHARASMD